MAAQVFFHQTCHANYGLFFGDDCNESNAQDCFNDIKARAEKLNQSDKSIYRVTAQTTPHGDGVQIFVAPFYQYSEIAELLLDEFKHNKKAYITEKNLVKRLVKKKSFIEQLRKITRDHVDDKAQSIKLTVALIKSYYENECSRLNREVELIANEYHMGKVKSQEYYRGLAETWLEFPDQQENPI